MLKKIQDNVFNDIRTDFSELFKVLSKEYMNVSILIEKSTGRNYRVSKSGTIIKDNTFAANGAVIRLYSKIGAYEYSFNDFSKDFMKKIPSVIKCNIEKMAKENTYDSMEDIVGLEENDTETKKNRIIFNKSTEYEISPSDMSDDEITERLTTLHNKAMSYNESIIDCVCVYQYLQIHKMYIDKEKDLQQHIMWSNGLIQPMAAKDDETRYYLQMFSGICGAELLNKMNCDFTYACKCVTELLDSETPKPGMYDVICMPDVTGMIAHEAFGHGVEMDMFVKDRALAAKYIDKYVASDIVTMHDNAATCVQCGSFFFDDEGTISNDTVIIKNGILKNGINDLRSAKRLNVSPTGNGRRESYERKAYTRMTNTYFEAGKSNLEEMIASIENGLLLENACSGMEDPKNWGIQCMVNIGREIKNGKLTGRIFSPICLSGYVPDLLKSITMISGEIEISGCGYCGKGYKEWVKVSDGGAAIKAKVRIS